MTDGLQLVMSQGPQPGQAFAIDRDQMTMGREPGNAIAVDDPQVSRQHARITRQGAVIMIEDLGSTNGTFVNGMRLTGPRALTPGDVISLGEAVTMTFYSTGAASTEDMGAPLSAAPFAAPAPPYGVTAPEPQPFAPPAYEPSIYEPEVAPGALAEASPFDEDGDAAVGKGDSEAKRRQYLLIGCGCLALFLACLAVALFLWFAPASFWDALIELGIPIPPNPF